MVAQKAIITEDYLLFKEGEEVELCRSQPKQSSIRVVKSGMEFDIPEGFYYMKSGHVKPGWSSTSTSTSPSSSTATGRKRRSAPAAGNIPNTNGTQQPPSFDELLSQWGEDPDKPKKKVSKRQKPVRNLEDWQVPMSVYTGGRLPKSGIDHIIRLHPSDTWAEEYWHMIPDFDPHHVWDPNVLEALIVADHTEERCLLVGWPGTGKTSSHRQYCAIIGQPFIRSNGKEGMEPSSIVGGLGPIGKDEWGWKDSHLPIAMKIGAYYIIDEVMKLGAGLQMTMQSVYERGGPLMLDDKPGSLEEKIVQPHPKFRINATDNVRGLGDNFDKSAATQMQDTSSLDRFGMYCEVPYLQEDDEVGMLERKFPKQNIETLTAIVQLAGLVRTAYQDDDVSLTLSPRGLEAACRFMEHGLDVKSSMYLAFGAKLADEPEKAAYEEWVRTTGLEMLS